MRGYGNQSRANDQVFKKNTIRIKNIIFTLNNIGLIQTYTGNTPKHTEKNKWRPYPHNSTNHTLGKTRQRHPIISYAIYTDKNIPGRKRGLHTINNHPKGDFTQEILMVDYVYNWYKGNNLRVSYFPTDLIQFDLKKHFILIYAYKHLIYFETSRNNNYW